MIIAATVVLAVLIPLWIILVTYLLFGLITLLGAKNGRRFAKRFVNPS
jgi:hypothetical protein